MKYASTRLVILAIPIISLILIGLWIFQKSRFVGDKAKPTVEAVLKAYFRSRITGEYWENEMLNQKEYVLNLPQQDRLDFFRSILLLGDLDTSRALLFVELLGDDADELRAQLLELKESGEFSYLSATEQEEVNSWMDELRIVTAY